MSYMRFFMPLIHEAGGYGLSGREPAGRSIVEGRGSGGKVSVWVQDLKPQVKYEVCLVFRQVDKGAYVALKFGGLVVDEKGKGEFKRSITAEDLHGFDLGNISGVAIVASGNVAPVSPLCGHREGDTAWRGQFKYWEPPTSVVEEATAPKVKELEPELKTAEPEVVVEPELKAAEPEAVTEPELKTAEPEAAMKPEPKAPEPKATTTPELKAPSPDPIQPILTPPLATLPPPPSPPKATKPPEGMNLVIRKIMNANPQATPFAKETRRAIWVTCDTLSHMPLPERFAHGMDSPFIRAAWATHGHFILGLTTDQEPPQYMIGLPGIYSQENKQTAKGLGFTHFKCPQKDRNRVGDDGYWLMFVNIEG